MRATVEVYENNAGGIFVAVFGQNGLKKLFVVAPDNNETRMTRAFYQEALYGFSGVDDYNAEDFPVCLWMMLIWISAAAT